LSAAPRQRNVYQSAKKLLLLAGWLACLLGAGIQQKSANEKNEGEKYLFIII